MDRAAGGTAANAFAAADAEVDLMVRFLPIVGADEPAGFFRRRPGGKDAGGRGGVDALDNESRMDGGTRANGRSPFDSGPVGASQLRTCLSISVQAGLSTQEDDPAMRDQFMDDCARRMAGFQRQRSATVAEMLRAAYEARATLINDAKGTGG
jgi:hypothetical protein